MKMSEYARMYNIKTPENWQEHFRKNMATGQGSVALTYCGNCDEIIDVPTANGCPKCRSRR